MYHRKKEYFSKACIAPLVTNSLKFSVNKISSKINRFNPKDNHAYLHLSHIQYDKYQNPSSYTFSDILLTKIYWNWKRDIPLQVSIQQKRKKYGSANFHKQLIYETSKTLPYLLHQLCVILKRNLYEYKKQLSGSCSLKLDNTEKEQGNNSVKK